MPKPALTPNAWMRWDRIRQHLGGLPRDLRILEFGPGQGALGTRLVEYGSYVAIEPDPTSRDIARRNLPAGARVLSALAELGEEETFDLICAFEVIEHIPDDEGELRRWCTRLAPGGTLMLSVPAHEHRFAEADKIAGHVRRHSRESLTRLLESCELVVCHIDAIGGPLGYVLEIGRNRLAARKLAQIGTPAEQTGASARMLQPPAAAGLATQVATLPFRLLQRPLRRTELGTGWVAVARRPG